MKKKLLIFIALILVAAISLFGCNVTTGSVVSTVSSSSSASNAFHYGGDVGQSVAVNVVTLTETSLEEAEDLKTVLKRISSTVVEVYSTLENGSGAGSGVVVGKAADGDKVISYIATCHHVIEDAIAVKVKTVDGVEYAASLVGSDPDTDICVMSVEASLQVAAVASASSALEVGEEVVAIGNPLGTLGGTVTKGIISAVSRDIVVGGKTMTLLQTDAAINSGNSGGGLFTASGVLVGIVNAKYNGSINSAVEGLGFAIPYNVLVDISTQLIETQTVNSPGYIEGKYILGCTVANYYTSRWGSQGYIYVSALDQTGSFYKSGIRVDDRLVSYTWGEQVYTVTAAADFVENINKINFKVGDKILFNIIRNNTSQTIEVTITQYVYGNW